MKNIYRREEWNKKDEIYESDAYCPSIEKALFKEHKLEELLAENQLKKLGLETAEALIKALYEEVKRLEIENFEYRSEMEEMYREFCEKEKELEREIHYLRCKSFEKRREKKFEESKEYLSNILMPDISRRLPVVQREYNDSMERENGRGGTSPIKKMGVMEAVSVSKEYVDMREDIISEKPKLLYEQARDYFMSEELNKVLVDFEDMTDVLREEKEQFDTYKEKYVENEIQINYLNKELNSFNFTTSTKPSNSIQSQYHTADSNYCNKVNKKIVIKGKKLFSTENDNNEALSPERMEFSPFIDGEVKNEFKNSTDKKETYNITKIIKEYEEIIQNYKEYSAYLKAYLCSCIGFISKQNEQFEFEKKINIEETQRSKEFGNSEMPSTGISTHFIELPSNKLFSFIRTSILEKISEKVSFEQEIRKEVEKENRELKSILDELISNLKITGYPGLSSIKEKKESYIYHENEFVKNMEVKRKEKSKIKNERNSKNKDTKINISKPIIHRMTITEANNYYHPTK